MKKGEQTIVRNYRVLGIFSKHYNKWFVEFEQKQVVFDPQSKTWKRYSKKYKLLTRMMKFTEQSDYLRRGQVKNMASGVQRPFLCCVTGRCAVS